MQKKYFPEIDVLKGITILLVVLGHCFCTNPINLFEELPMLGNVVRSFQMPLFFVVSGFLFSTSGGLSVLLKKKTSRLLIPYVAFGILTIILRYVFSAFTNGGEVLLGTSLLKLLNGEYYWFLYTLILIMIAVQIIRNKIIMALVSVGLIVLCLFTDIRTCSFMTFGKIVYYLPFFVLGFSLKGMYMRLLEVYDKFKIILPCSLILFGISFLISENVDVLTGGRLYVRPMLGILTTWLLAIEFSNSCLKSSSVFAHFGKYSLQYYLNHLLIMLPFYKLAGHLSYMNPLVPLMLIFVCAVVTSYVMLIIEKRFKTTRMLCGLK